jgi:hypothetical protein
MPAWPTPSASRIPRPGDPGKTKLIYQYNGTRDEAIAVVNDATGDIVSPLTELAERYEDFPEHRAETAEEITAVLMRFLDAAPWPR